MGVQWYVLRAKPNKELALWRELTARGFECFYPCLHVKPVNPRSRKIRPYFPGYLFVHVDMEQTGVSTFPWMPFSTGFVSFQEVPATIPHSVVEAIRRHVDATNAAGGEQLAGLKRGEAVVIQGGPFDGYEAIFDARLPGKERVRVFLKFIEKRQVHVDLPSSQIRRKARRR